MAWRTSPPELVALFDRMLPAGAGLERRTMFGCKVAFADGQMIAGLHDASFFLRAADADRAALTADGARPFSPLPGRESRHHLILPDSVLADPEALAGLVARARAHAATLPPKPKRTSRATARPAARR